MKTRYWFLILALAGSVFAAEPAPPTAATPPSAPPKSSAAELEKLLAPIALYSDSLIATVLPASVYPLEIVQAARFVQDTNNLAKLDDQPWDDNVKAVARIPAVIQKMNDDLSWTVALGEAFLEQDKEVMDTIQALRLKANKAGTLQTTDQQVVMVTNTVTEKTVEQQIVYVTNTIVQIASANPQVVYVPTYNPYTVYYPPPYYVYNPYAPLVTFGVGIAVGAIIANNGCYWHGGGCYHGYHGNVNINVNRNNNININNNNGNRTQQKWQPDQSRLSKSGSSGVANSARSSEARGWGSSPARQPSTGSVGTRPSTGTAGARPSTGTVGTRPTASPAATRPAAPAAPAARPATSPSVSRPAPSQSSGQSAFGGMSNGNSTRQSSTRGSTSRSSGGGGSRGGGRGR